MALKAGQIRAVLFDFGNTLIRFGEVELARYGLSLAGALEEHYGPLDMDAFFALREQSRTDPFAGDEPTYRENDLRFITARLVRELYGKEPDEETMAALLRTRFDSFVDAVEVEDDVAPLLDRLGKGYPLGLLSNYPDGPAIRASLDKIGLTQYFDSIVVSGEVGFCKPHPITFATSMKQFGLPSREILFVGDNWLADIQGAKRVGMQVVYMKRWRCAEASAPQPGDHLPDAEIGRLSELPALLAYDGPASPKGE